jgi:hypothetical protein
MLFIKKKKKLVFPSEKKNGNYKNKTQLNTKYKQTMTQFQVFLFTFHFLKEIRWFTKYFPLKNLCS